MDHYFIAIVISFWDALKLDLKKCFINKKFVIKKLY